MDDKIDDLVAAVGCSNCPIKDAASLEFIDDIKDRDYESLTPKQKAWVDSLWERI